MTLGQLRHVCVRAFLYVLFLARNLIRQSPAIKLIVSAQENQGINWTVTPRGAERSLSSSCVPERE